MATRVVLAVDLGGTTMKGVVVDETGREVADLERPTPTAGVVEALGDLLGELGSVARGQGLTPVGAAVVSPGSVDEGQGVVRYASNLGWRDVPLRDLLEPAVGLPIAVAHDVRTAGLAEWRFGAARGSDDVVLVPIGTGVAAAVVSAGGLVTGATGTAGEFGHIPVVPDGEPCACGQRGCLEVYASGAGVARRYAARTGSVATAREVVARLGSDPDADEVWAEAVTVLARGLAILTLLLDPSVIVLGGGFSHAGEALLVPLGAELRDGLAWRAPPEVAVSRLGDRAGRVGAAVLAFEAAGLGDLVTAWPTS
ncbi:ROK family protein [Pedococcus dokdonensis]|uniref:ROK family protein n=1 Tax=Pedococcus dokdonensis TaxID=443156 RepID=UPI001E4FFE4A|nr:ROK family protein [Pedococcus dokdonensis]